MSGLFCCAALIAVFLLVTAGVAAAEPLAIELVDVQPAYDQRTSEPLISFKMSESSGRAFAELTRSNVGRKMAMRIDGQTISSPIIREPISGGSGQISGHFTGQQVRDIAARLSSGMSKLEIEIVD